MAGLCAGHLRTAALLTFTCLMWAALLSYMYRNRPLPLAAQLTRRLQVQGRPGFPRQYAGLLDCAGQVGFGYWMLASC